MRNEKSLLLMFLAVVLLTGCSTSWDSITDERTYEAYGKTWKYLEIRHYESGWWVGTTHGIIGKVEKISQTAYLTSDSGEKIPVHERLFALQKDGQYTKAECCDNPWHFIDLYQVEGKLILRLMQTRENVTDCWVYPAGLPRNYRQEEGEVYRVDFFGDFDPATRRFEIGDFIPKQAVYDEIYKKYGNRPNRNQEIEMTYANRAPFICDGK